MRFAVEIPNPPQQVYDAVADFERLPEWDPMVSRAERTGEPMQPGTRYRLATPRGMILEYEVVESDPPRRIVYSGGTKRVTSTDTIEVGPSGSGSRLQIATVLRFSGRMRLFAPLVVGGVWLGGRFRSLPGLKRHLREIRSDS